MIHSNVDVGGEGSMEAKISLEPFERILSGYQKIEELAVNVADCSKLAQKYARYGVEGYRLGNYVGTGYLNRYLECMVDRAPMLIYKRNYFDSSAFLDVQILLINYLKRIIEWKLFRLLEWSLKHQPGKILIEKNEKYDLKSKGDR